MQNLNRVVHVKSAKNDKPQKPLTNSVLVYLKWPCLILKCVGLLPFYTTHNHYDIGAPNQRWIKIGRAILLTKTVLNILHIYAFLSPTIMEMLFKRSKTDGITNLLDVVFCMLSDFTITWTCANSGTEIVLIINNLLKVDKILKQYPDSPAERPYASNLFNRYLFSIFGYIVFIMIGYVKRTLDYFSFKFCIYITFYQLENAISCGFVVFISAFLHLLAERFRFVNRLIAQYNSKILQHETCPLILSINRNSITHNEANLRLFAENSTVLYSLHIDLLDIYKMLNNYAGLGLLVFLLYSCYGLLSCAYGCFVSIWETTNDLYYVIWTFSWIPLYTVILRLLSTNCAKATKESSYEIGRPNRRAIFLNRATLVTKALLNILHIFTLLSPVILQVLFIRSQTDGITNMLDIVFCILSDVTITWTCARNTHKAINILNSFLKVDKLLQEFAYAPTERSRSINKFTVYLIWMFGFAGLSMIAYIKQSLTNFSFYFCAHTFVYQLETVISFTFVVFISALLHLLSERFQFVNQLIAQYNQGFLSSRILRRNASTQDKENLRQFAKNSVMIYSLHVDLLDIYKMINNYAGLGLLAFLLYACSGLLACTYICSLYDWVRNEDLYHVLWILLWISYFAAGLILLATNCAKATREANKTSQILARVYGKGKKYQTIIDKFLSKSIKQDVHFTAYDFFVIDNTTLFKISSALVTYLVILIQFKQLEKTKD